MNSTVETSGVNVTDRNDASESYVAGLNQRAVFTPLRRAKDKPNTRGKVAYRGAWQKKPVALGQIPQGENVGLLVQHAGLVDIDLDVPEARYAWARFCDTGTLAIGRGGEVTHYFYGGESSNVGFKNLPQFDDDDGNVLQVRHAGKQVMFVGSTHPDSGEPIEVMQDIPPLPLPDTKKIRLAATVALIAHVLNHDAQTGRHDLSLTLAGYLLRKLDVEDVEAIVEAAWECVGGDVEAALRNVADTAKKLAAGDKVSGGGVLDQHVKGLAAKIASYWGWETEAKTEGNAGDDLTRIGQEIVEELFVDQFGQPHALIDGRSVPVSSLGPRLQVKHLEDTGKTAGSDAEVRALKTLAAIAEVKGEKHDLKTRWAHVGGCIYYEVAPGRVYRIDASGWRIDPNPPVRFRAIKNLSPLPDPVREGTVDDLQNFIKLEGRDLRLYISLMASAPFDDIPRPILAMIGLKGRGKTTRSLFFKKLLDEDGTDFVRPTDDILRKATHRGIVACDNQSGLAKGVSDLLCGLVTGTGDAARRLYSDNEEFGFKVKRLVILNGINLASEQPDVLERSLIIEAPEITPSERIMESEF